MFKVTKYPHGTFCWGDCISQDADKAKPFYPAVMGWTLEDMVVDGHYVYSQFKLEGEDVAGLGQMQPEMMSAGVPSNWTNIVSVDNADAAAAKAAELGGTIIAPSMDIFEEGRLAMIQDPQGAVFGVWEANKHIGARLVNRAGAMCWNELATHDVEGAKTFYGGLFGWTFDKMPDTDGMEYYVIYNNGRANGGLMLMDEKWGEAPPNWMIYFSVDNLDTAIEKVKANGGSLGMPDIINSSVGKIIIAVDPAGAHFYLIETTNPDPWVE